MIKPGLEFVAMAFALFKAGAVPVLIDPGIGVMNLGRCLADAGTVRPSSESRAPGTRASALRQGIADGQSRGDG